MPNARRPRRRASQPRGQFPNHLYDALKIGLISTMRSNLSVGLPIDIVVIRRDALKAEVVRRIEQDEPYFYDLRARWSAALRAAHKAIARPPYGPGRGQFGVKRIARRTAISRLTK